VPTTGAGDFDADGRDDVWVHYAWSSEDAGAMLFLGGPWPERRYVYDDPDLVIQEFDGGFGAGVAAAGDVRGDGFDDTWFVAPSWLVEDQLRGKLYLFGGWGLDPASSAPAQHWDTAIPF
jgi:hypothetical protein